MNTTDPIDPDGSGTAARHRNGCRRLSLVLLAAALISATSCGSDSTTEAASGPITTTTTTVAAASTSTTSVLPPTSTALTVPRPSATVEQLVGDEGERVHVRCVGQGRTTVVLIAGFGAGAESWIKVEPAISARARVCSYDRPGIGTSDPPSGTATFTTQATDLHAVLTRIGEPGPYVVVGHSFGGAEAMMFASLYPDEVTGLVLIDASPTTWPAALCAVPDDGTDAAATVLGNCTGAFRPAGNSERLDVFAAFAEVSSVVSLSSLPLAVVTATERELPAGLAAPEVARLTRVWNQGQQDWVALSTAAHLVTVDHTGHNIEIDRPGVVIDEITRLLP